MESLHPDNTVTIRKLLPVFLALYVLLSSSFSYAIDEKSAKTITRGLQVNSATGGKMLNRIVTEEDNGREIELFVGDVIRVDLRFQSGTGYDWYPDLTGGSPLQYIHSRTVDLSEEGMVGGPVIGMWYFKVLVPGNAALTMLHYRVWEGRSKAIKNFNVKLRVIDRGRR